MLLLSATLVGGIDHVDINSYFFPVARVLCYMVESCGLRSPHSPLQQRKDHSRMTTAAVGECRLSWPLS